nr:DUF3558 family protein [Actinoalloteichus caeruleus]
MGLLSACTSAERGTAVAVELTVGSSLPGSADPSVGGSPGEQPGVDVAAELSEMLPCEILSDEEVTALGFDPESASFNDVGVSYSCNYRPPAGGTPLMYIGLDWKLSIDQLNLSNFIAEETSVGPLRALRITDKRWCSSGVGDPNRDTPESLVLRGHCSHSFLVVGGGQRHAGCPW